MKSKQLEDPLNIIKKYTTVIKKDETESVKTSSIFPIVNYNRADENPSSARSSDQKRTLHGDEEPYKRKKHKKRHKKHKSHRRKRKLSNSSEYSESGEDEIIKTEKTRKLEILRMERLRREQEERKRSELLLAKVFGKEVEKSKSSPRQRHVKQKYNSQFNPELAKQNYD